MDNKSFLFVQGKSYTDRGTNYKKFHDDQFTTKLIDVSGRTLTHNGGVRVKPFCNIKIQSPNNGGPIPAYLVLMSSSIRSEFENPWDDFIDYKNNLITYWGDAKGKTNILSYSGCNSLSKAISLSENNIRELIPPLLHFSKNKIGEVIFNGLCGIEEIVEEKYPFQGKNINNLKCSLRIIDTNIDALWLNKRSGSDFGPNQADREYGPKSWNDFIESGTFKKHSSVKKSSIWDDDKITVIMWMLMHKGFSIGDDSSRTNKIISEALEVKRSSLDMTSRHIKSHLLRLDLYGKKFRGSKVTSGIVDKYRPDQRNLRIDANNIAKEKGWYKKLKDLL